MRGGKRRGEERRGEERRGEERRGEKRRDNDYVRDIKTQMANEKGVTLIHIPCWWDGSEKRYFNISKIK